MVLANIAGLTAILAWAGVLGLISRFGDIEVAAAIDVAIFLAVPMTLTAHFAMNGDRRAALTAVASGSIVIVWLGTDLAAFETLVWVKPALAAVGAATFAIGLVRIVNTRPSSAA